MMNRQASIPTPRFVVDLPDDTHHHTTPVLVIGGGAAGLAAALEAARSTEVALLARGSLVDSNSAWAQGGIAAALDTADSPRFHVEDTLIAGAGLCDLAAVEALAYEAPALMREMAALGVPFERDNEDRFALGLEGGHSKRRIVHVGDATGLALARILIRQAQAHPRIRILEGFQAVDLLGDGRCTGALALDAAGRWHRFSAGATVLAMGGAGALYGLTSNQPTALGEGIAMAYRAGAEVADMEFVQFHPTVMRTRAGSGFLISEAARGEGGRLLTLAGERFMPAFDPRGELAPRDVVTRGIFAAMQRTGSDHVLLDLTHLSRAFLEQRFPTIYGRCREEGIDPATRPIPVAPASHYLMGGIRTDLDGASSLPGLYAAGECACTGVHGANRLASNSLLECLVFGRRAGRAAAAEMSGWRLEIGEIGETGPSLPHLQPPVSPGSSWRDALAGLMRAHAGPARSPAGLREALRRLDAMAARQSAVLRPFGYAQSRLRSGQVRNPQSTVSESVTAANALLAARLIVASALFRRESRGAHYRTDVPGPDESWLAHTILAAGQPPRLAATIAAVQVVVVGGD